MLPEPNRQVRINMNSDHTQDSETSLYSNTTDNQSTLGTPTSAYSSGRFRTLLKRTAESSTSKESGLQLNLYKPLAGGSGNFGDSLDTRNQAGKSKGQVKLKRYRQTVSSFLKMATRDLREPMAILTTGLAVLKRFNAGDETQTQIIEEMERALDRATNVIGTYLELDQFETMGRLDLRCEPISIRTLVNQEIAKLSTVVPDKILKRCRVENFISEKARLWADPDKIKQVFAVLLSRAVLSTSKDGTVSIEHRTMDDTEVVEIRSQGRRIGADTIDALASPFLDRASDKLTRLDLAAARKLVEVHQGKLLFDEQIRHGSRIWVVLPSLRDSA